MNHPTFLVHADAELAPLIPNYLERVKKHCQELSQAIEKGDLALCQTYGHQMKGSGGGYGFQKISELGGFLEKAAIQGNLSEVQHHLNELKDYLEHIEVVYE